MKRFLQLLFCSALLLGCETTAPEIDGGQEPGTGGIEFAEGTNLTPVFSAEGGSVTVAFTSGDDWSVGTSAEWISVSPESGKAGAVKVSITLAENASGEERTGEVTITLSNAVTGKITVRQQASEEPDKPKPDGVNNVILYTTSDGNIVKPGYEDYYGENVVDDADVFGANIVSNTYENGQGKILFDSDVTAIGELAFWACNNLTSMIIPNSVTIIKNQAFLSCQNLADFIIPDSVTEIGTGAFAYCSSLTSITIPAGVTTIGGGVFAGCTNLERFEGKFASADNRCLISDGTLISIAPADLTQYTIPDGVTIIGNNAFEGCSSLTSIVIPADVTEIGTGAFAYCSSLTSITIPDGVTIIGNNAFGDCSSLTSITIPDSVTSIGKYAFMGCSSLASSITIPDSVTTIEEGAFAYCSLLEKFEGKFASADNRCLISNGTLIAFAPAGLTQYTIPDSVTSIGEIAISGCDSLASVTIGEGVTSIGNWAFDWCFNLTSIYCKPTTPPACGYNIFGQTAPEIIYVPTSSVSAYKAAEGWKDSAGKIVGYDF